MEELTKVSHKLAEEIYKAANAKQQQSQQGSSGPGPAGENASAEPQPGGKKDEDIIDAEYKEENGEGKK